MKNPLFNLISVKEERCNGKKNVTLKGNYPLASRAISLAGPHKYSRGVWNRKVWALSDGENKHHIFIHANANVCIYIYMSVCIYITCITVMRHPSDGVRA